MEIKNLKSRVIPEIPLSRRMGMKLLGDGNSRTLHISVINTKKLEISSFLYPRSLKFKMLTVETRPYLETFLRVNDFVEPIFLTNSYRVKSCLSVNLNKKQ